MSVIALSWTAIIQADGEPYVINQPFSFFLFDFDTGVDEGLLTEYTEVTTCRTLCRSKCTS